MNDFWKVLGVVAAGAFVGLLVGQVIGHFVSRGIRQTMTALITRQQALTNELLGLDKELGLLRDTLSVVEAGPLENVGSTLPMLRSKLDVLLERDQEIEQETHRILKEVREMEKKHPWIFKLLRVNAFLINRELPSSFSEGPNVST
jgi:hypothetical protein